jgi:hypothetical protein
MFHISLKTQTVSSTDKFKELRDRRWLDWTPGVGGILGLRIEFGGEISD